MLEILIIIIIIMAVKKSREKASSPKTPPVQVPVRPQAPSLSRTAVDRKVNQRIFGTEDLKDRTAVYNRLLLTDRYQSMEKIAHELGISRQQVLREIKDLKAQGHYPDITVDEKNYRLSYPAVSKTRRNSSKAFTSKTARTAPKEKSGSEESRTYVQPSKPYRPARNAAERYEEWIPLSAGKEVVRCSYCGAENQIPKGSSPGHFTCYFCREEL